MIIRKFREIFIPKSENVTQEVTSSPIVDEDTTDYHLWIEDDIKSLESPIHECGPSHFSHGYSPYTGVPAPAYLPEDPWFPTPILSENQMTLKEAHEQAVADQQIIDERKESEDIHQKLYELATKSGKTTTQLNPVGGSETFQEGPGGWTSGTGYQGQGLADR